MLFAARSSEVRDAYRKAAATNFKARKGKHPRGEVEALTLPHDAPYVISRPETITATIPKAALASGSADVVATPPLRLAAVGGSARVRGTFIADEVPASFVNETIFEYLILALPPALRLGWVADLAEFNSEATIDLLSTIERALLHINDTSYDVFDVTCFAPPPPPPGVNLTLNASNATNGSNATNASAFNFTAIYEAFLTTLPTMPPTMPPTDKPVAGDIAAAARQSCPNCWR